MVIDVHADIGDWAFRPLMHRDAAGMLELMARAGIDVAIVGPVEGILYRDPCMARELLLERLEEVGGLKSLRPAAVINPTFPGWERDLAEWKEAGAVAVKMYPGYHGYEADGREARRLAAATAEMRLPLIVVIRVEDERNHHPLMLVPPVSVDSVARLKKSEKRGKLVLAGANQTEIEGFSALTQSDNSVYIEISYLKSPTNAVEAMVAKVSANRLLFGSHAPFFDPRVTLAKVGSARIGDAERVAILGDNASALFGW